MILNDLIIVIPCYNEANRLSIHKFSSFLENVKNVSILFINDASTDSTLKNLNHFKAQMPEKVTVLSNSKNLGKAESVRKGVLYCLDNDLCHKIAYLDADLATSLEECHSYSVFIENGKKFVFASRILKIGSVIQRKFSRFILGRIIATFISNILDIKVYDTQCGCKVFTSDIAKIAFGKPFISKWLFDVEIFSRLIRHFGKENALNLMEEVPVKRWVDKGESKVKLTYFFNLWMDLIHIWQNHKKGLS